ncbi:hypothetical protein MFRU_001g04040 [Monilinia fructicola]|uniref:Uncharacterized protein n=1 Tax=Monilinia fructicola TaxID=38448 RepID=A0A5M9JZP2_MONFR|nr:hypothetical protein EYC84_005212 [Monilinia fructicola]KAG4035635.1 hypothetical protein MFRU_001g04040 [Monilinia fructicola]
MSSDNQTTPSSSTLPSPPASAGTSRVRPRRFYMLRAFIYRLLPLMLFTVFLITGTVILIYAVVNKRALPPKFIIGSFLTIGILVLSWAALRTILFLRREFGTRGVDEAEAKMHRLRRLGAGKQGWSRKCWRWLRETGVLIGKWGARSEGARSPVRGRNGVGARGSPRNPPAGGAQEDAKVAREGVQSRDVGCAVPDARISPLQLEATCSPPSFPGPQKQNQHDSGRKPTLHPSRGTEKSRGASTVNSTKVRSRDKLTTAHPSPPHASQPVIYIEGQPQKMKSQTHGSAHQPIPSRQDVSSTDTPRWHTPQQAFSRPVYYPRPARALPPSLSIEHILAHPQVHAQEMPSDHNPPRPMHPQSQTRKPLRETCHGAQPCVSQKTSPQRKAPHQKEDRTLPAHSPLRNPWHREQNEGLQQNEPQSQSRAPHEQGRYSAYNPPPSQIIPEITSAPSRRYTVPCFSGPTELQRLESMKFEMKMDADGYYRHGLYDQRDP